MKIAGMLALMFFFNIPVALPMNIFTSVSTLAITIPIPTNVLAYRISKLEIKDIERLTGKKLTLKEKLVIKIYQLKLRREIRNSVNEIPQSKKGKTSLTLGILSIIAALAILLTPWFLLASVPLAIMAIVIGNRAEKESPGDKKARAGSLIGWISLGFVVVLSFIVLLFVIAFAGVFN